MMDNKIIRTIDSLHLRVADVRLREVGAVLDAVHDGEPLDVMSAENKMILQTSPLGNWMLTSYGSSLEASVQ